MIVFYELLWLKIVNKAASDKEDELRYIIQILSWKFVFFSPDSSALGSLPYILPSVLCFRSHFSPLPFCLSSLSQLFLQSLFQYLFFFFRSSQSSLGQLVLTIKLSVLTQYYANRFYQISWSTGWLRLLSLVTLRVCRAPVLA